MNWLSRRWRRRRGWWRVIHCGIRIRCHNSTIISLIFFLVFYFIVFLSLFILIISQKSIKTR
jgi:hypothetical protein